MKQCPTCEQSLRSIQESGVPIDVCDQCHGVWLDPGELDALTQDAEFQPGTPDVDIRPDLKCPRCHQQGFKNVDTNIGTFARCIHCGGLFVDGTTLDTLIISIGAAAPGHGATESLTLSAEIINLLAEILSLFRPH